MKAKKEALERNWNKTFNACIGLYNMPENAKVLDIIFGLIQDHLFFFLWTWNHPPRAISAQYYSLKYIDGGLTVCVPSCVRLHEARCQESDKFDESQPDIAASLKTLKKVPITALAGAR